MRTFSCFTRDTRSDVPTLSIVLTETLERARQLARRELMDTPDGIAVDIVENGRLVDVLLREPALA